MSRIGNKPVKIESGVKIDLKDKTLNLSGPKGNLTLKVHPEINVELDQDIGEIRVVRPSDSREHRSLHGTMRSLIANMVEGVSRGYQRKMEIYGTGYGVKVQGPDISLTVGTAKPHNLKIPGGVNVDIETPNARGNDVPAVFTITGPDKQVVGQFASDIRRVRPPEPYLGKGIRYADEVIVRKEGKAFGSA